MYVVKTTIIPKTELEQRVKEIAAYTVDDYFKSGNNSFDESPESVKTLIYDELAKDSFINDAHTYQISLEVLKNLNCLNMVDINFIEKTLFTGGIR